MAEDDEHLDTPPKGTQMVIGKGGHGDNDADFWREFATSLGDEDILSTIKRSGTEEVRDAAQDDDDSSQKEYNPQ